MKVAETTAIWNGSLDAEWCGAVRAITAMGAKAELRYDKVDMKLHLVAVRYKGA